MRKFSTYKGLFVGGGGASGSNKVDYHNDNYLPSTTPLVANNDNDSQHYPIDDESYGSMILGTDTTSGQQYNTTSTDNNNDKASSTPLPTLSRKAIKHLHNAAAHDAMAKSILESSKSK